MSANGRKLFLGGLTKMTTTDMLYEAFSKYGQVVDAVVMEKNGSPRGFGFVTFKEKSSLACVLAEDVVIDGRVIDVKRAVPEEEMDSCPTKVFIGGLSQNVDKTMLKRHFETFGTVRDAVVMMDRSTSRSRGFGFVRFVAPNAVEKVLQCPHLLDGQWVDVKRAQPADELPGSKPASARPSKEVRTSKDMPRVSQRSSKKEAAPAPQPAAYDPNWAMWSLLSLAQNPAFGAAFPAAGMPAGMPGMEGLSVEQLSGMIAAMQLGQAAPVAPVVSPTATAFAAPVPVDAGEEAAPQESKPVPLGDLSNVINSVLNSPAAGKSLNKRLPSMSPTSRVNIPMMDITNDVTMQPNNIVA